MLETLEKRGFSEVIVTGGHLSASFIREKLVDEIWFNIMPRVFTNGTNLFEGKCGDTKLKLLECQKSTASEVFLKYKLDS